MATSLRLHAALALLVIIIQIALGGWVSTNYAARSPAATSPRAWRLAPRDGLRARLTASSANSARQSTATLSLRRLDRHSLDIGPAS